MYGAVVILAAVLLAQGSDEGPAQLPWVFHLKSGEIVYGFADEREIEDPRRTSWNVVLDAPWLSDAARKRSIGRHELKKEADGSTVLPYREFKEPREKRIEAGWEAHGGVLKTVEGGEEAWVSKSAWEASEEAKRLAQARSVPSEDASALEESDATVGAGRLEANQPGVFTLWGPHAIVLGLGLAAMSAVYVFLVRR